MKTSSSFRSWGLMAIVCLLAFLGLREMSHFRLNSGTGAEPAISPPLKTDPAKVNVRTMDAVNPNRQAAVTPRNETNPLDQKAMLRHLKHWIKQRDGIEAEVVDAQPVMDINGQAVSLNVILTTNLAAPPDVVYIKDLLAKTAAIEKVQRRELTDAYRGSNTNAVNSRVRQIVTQREQLVATNGFLSYKLSLASNNPPVLSYWTGLPIETTRFESARQLAETILGEPVTQNGLVHYTSAAALISFRSNQGRTALIDPSNLAEVSAAKLQEIEGRGSVRDPAQRASRIQAQWQQFLSLN